MTLRRVERQAGFTLVEMLVVLAVLAGLLGLVLTRGPARSAALDMREAAGAVAGALRLARGQAIAGNRSVAVAFKPAGARFQVGAGPVRGLPAGIALAVVSAQEQRAAIRFFPDGSSSGGRVELAGRGRGAQIGVDWLTGRVSVGSVP